MACKAALKVAIEPFEITTPHRPDPLVTQPRGMKRPAIGRETAVDADTRPTYSPRLPLIAKNTHEFMSFGREWVGLQPQSGAGAPHLRLGWAESRCMGPSHDGDQDDLDNRREPGNIARPA